jgi:hypothetical protein
VIEIKNENRMLINRQKKQDSIVEAAGREDIRGIIKASEAKKGGG